jgi:hypothetical protein
MLVDSVFDVSKMYYQRYISRQDRWKVASWTRHPQMSIHHTKISGLRFLEISNLANFQKIRFPPAAGSTDMRFRQPLTSPQHIYSCVCGHTLPFCEMRSFGTVSIFKMRHFVGGSCHRTGSQLSRVPMDPVLIAGTVAKARHKTSNMLSGV